MAPDPKLEERWILLDECWKKMMALTDGLPNEQFAWRPDEGQWSIDQVLYHLYIAERGSLEYVKKKTSGTNTIPQAGVINELKWQGLKRALVSKKKWKAPAIVANIPPVEDHEELIRDFEDTRKECREYLENLPMNRRTAEVFKHALAGRLNAYRMLDFFIHHFEHHRYQIERIMEAMKKKKDV